MATGATVRVTGLNETLRALNYVNKSAAKVVKDELGRAVQPVAATAKETIGQYRGASVSTIGPRVSTRSVFVTQRARKKTGLRGDFGALQMRHLFAAFAKHEDSVVDDVGDALDRLAERAGF